MSQYWVYASIVEGCLIVLMLAWEIFWLSRIYKVLQMMPTSTQLQTMVEMIKGDRDLIKSTLNNMGTVFDSVKSMFGGLLSLPK